jgi:hypothetical protein
VIARLWREHRVLLVAFVAAVLLAVFFGARAIWFAVYWADPAHRDQAPKGWMTPGYVARSWDVPREVMAEALGIDPEPGRHRTLADIARARGVTVEALAEEIADAVAGYRAGGGDE